MVETKQAADERMAALVAELAAQGTTKAELEEAFSSALSAAFRPVIAPNVEISSRELLKAPATASDAQAAFREVYTGPITTTATQNLISAVITDRATAFTFQYERVYAVGFMALCDAFLPATCIANEEAATRSALCFSLGLDQARLVADAKALAGQAACMSKAELLASADLRQIAEATNFKYTYVFGVGLVTLMKAVGEELTMKGERGTWYKPATGDDGPIDEWCRELVLDRYAKRLAQDTSAPLAIDRIGTFNFPGLLAKASPAEDP